jgi:hypothetical protein
LRCFETLFPEIIDTPLEIKPVWDGLWDAEEKRTIPPHNWQRLTGVYVFADVCQADGLQSDVPDHFTVIPRLGETDDFGGRFQKYCHPKWEPYTYDGDSRWFRYRWIDIIPMGGKAAFLRKALEYFLIAKLHPMQNTDGVPSPNTALVFDEREDQSPPLRH